MKRISFENKHGASHTKTKLLRAKTARLKVMAALLTAVMLLSFLTVNGADAVADTSAGYEQTGEIENGLQIDAEEELAETPAEETPESGEETADENQDGGISDESTEADEPEEAPAPDNTRDLNLNNLNEGNPGFGYEVAQSGSYKILTFNADAGGNEYTITQDDGTHGFQQIIVADGVTTTITIDGISLKSSATGANLFGLRGTAKVTLLLAGNNTLTQTATGATGTNGALNVPENAAITIDGAGTLTTQGGAGSAGIGGSFNETAGTITINGGTVTATGGENGAGIGGGRNGNGGTISISGGTVTATSGRGAGIGGGENGAGGIIEISGGTVDATGGRGAGIGGGYGDTVGNVIITIDGTANVTAKNIKGGAGIGAGDTATADDVGTITIGGNAQVTATGGENGAGIGGGWNDPDYKGSAGTITITGTATVTATGGTDTLGNGGAGIGAGAYNEGTGARLTIDSGARVKAYAGNINSTASGYRPGDPNGKGIVTPKAARPAIHAETYKGTAFLVNAKMGDRVTSETALRVSANGEKQNLTLPAGYASFAYTTGSSSQTDRITAFTGGKLSGVVVCTSGSNPEQITSANTAVATAVKINPVNAIDLSDSATWGGAGYLVNTNAPRVLTFQQNGEYYVYQSGASLIRNIVVNDNVTATITIDGITVTSSAQDVPAFALKGSAKVTLILENNNTLTQTATNEGNNAALNVPSGASITLYGSGKLDARSGVNSAAIGGGQNSSGGTIEISGGTVTATAGLYGAGIGSGHRGIGCTTTIDSGIITISGGTVTATGGAFGAGIGGGYNSNGGTTTINGGIVTATGRIGGAGIGGGLADTNFTKTGVGGTIAIGGNAKVTATGGRNSFSYAYAGAGIGSGGDQPDGGTITITGNANVTATGGLNELSSGTHGGAGIGSGYVSGGNGACALTIDASATVKAYAYGSGAIQSANNGEGCFVNAYFNDTDKADLPVSGGTRLDIYEKLAAVKTNELVLPEGYYAFAYTTKNSKTQDDRILAYGASTGSILGTVLRSINNSEKIESVKKSNERLAVKLGSSPGVPSVPDITPSVTNVTENEATFTSTGHALLNTVAFVSGGFQYSLNPDMSNATLVPWNIGGFTTAPVSVSATGLEANTRYYMRTQLTARVDVEDFPASGKIEERTYYSEVVPFATLPKIISANVKPDQAGEKTLVSAKFYESTKNKAKITNVTVYWSTGSIDASDPGKVTASGGATLNSQTLEGAAFSDSGFSDYGITTPGAKNNILIVVTNEDGRRASYAPATTLTISSEVGGDYADTTKEFAMRVKFTYKDGEALAANTAFSYTGSAISGVTAPAGGILRTNEDGEVFFGLRHGQSITIAGVVSDGTVQITQTKALAYSAVSFTDSEGNGGESNDTGVRNMTPNPRSFSFTNTRDNVAPAGIDGGNINAMLLLPLLGLLALFGFWIIRRVYCRRNGGDRR